MPSPRACRGCWPHAPVTTRSSSPRATGTTPNPTTAATSPPTSPTSSTPGRCNAVTHHVNKGQGIPAYSLFEGTTDAGERVAELLTADGVTDVDVTGIATDYCVRASARDAIEHGLHVRILTDLVAGVAADSSQAALAELAHAGAELVTADAE